MSLVLEALKKLDRDKGRDERGFVVMAATPWPTRAARRWPLWTGLGLAAAAGTIAAIAILQRATPEARPKPAPVNPARGGVTTSQPAPATAAAAAARRPAIPVARAAEPPLVEAPRPEAPARPARQEGLLLRLQAISERDGQPIAIVNDHLVRVGDEFEGVRVLAIRGTEVDVEVHGRRQTLRF